MVTCEHPERLQPISTIVVWYGPTKPRVVLAEGDFRPCVCCEQLFEEVDAALARKGIPAWSKALVIAVDGQRVSVTRRASGLPAVTA